MESPGKSVLLRRNLSGGVERHPYGANATVAVHIRHLREKLEIDPANPRYLKVLWGHGYKMGGRSRMKLARSSPFKFIAVLLCVVCITLGTVSAWQSPRLPGTGATIRTRDNFVASMQAGTVQEDIYKVSQYYSLLMNGLPWTDQMVPTTGLFLPGTTPIFSSPSRIIAPATSCCQLPGPGQQLRHQ